MYISVTFVAEIRQRNEKKCETEIKTNKEEISRKGKEEREFLLLG